MTYFNYITISTPDNIEIKYRLAGLGSRLAAAVADFLIQGAVLGLMIAVFLSFDVGKYSNAFLYGIQDTVTAAFIIGIFVFTFGYYLLFELFMRGQTPGKKLFKLRVIKENGQAAGFIPILIRLILRFFVDIFAVGVFTIWFSKKSKRLGDMAASTIVIAENPKRVLNESLSLNSLEKSARDVTPVVSRLSVTKDEYDVLKEYFGRKEHLADGGAALLLKIRAHFADKFSAPAEKISEEILLEITRLNRTNYRD